MFTSVWISKLSRWPLYASIVLFGVAAALGHWIAPEMESRWPASGSRTPVLVEGPGLRETYSFVAGEGGELEELRVPGGSLDVPAVSPWQDGLTTRQVVGRWIETRGTGTSRVQTFSGLARLSYPDGELLDRIATDVVPGGPPCWTSRTSDTIVFNTPAGQLYRFAFSGSRVPGAVAGRDPRPTPVEWPVGMWTELEVQDLSKPYGTGCQGVYLASVRYRVEPGPDGVRQAIWWLQLDEDGSRVRNGGRLTEVIPDSSVAERFPVVGRTAEGGYALAYLAQRHGESEWTLRTVPIDFDPKGFVPVLARGHGERLARRCALSPPAFVDGGRSIRAVRDTVAEGGPVLLSVVLAGDAIARSPEENRQ